MPEDREHRLLDGSGLSLLEAFFFCRNCCTFTPLITFYSPTTHNHDIHGPVKRSLPTPEIIPENIHIYDT